MAPPLATRSREQRNADRRPRRARLGTRSLAPQIGNDLLEIGELAVRRRTHLRTSSGPTFRADHTAIGASDHVLPVRRISPAFRMSAKDLHARPTAVSPRRNPVVTARSGEGLLTESQPPLSLRGRNRSLCPLSGHSIDAIKGLLPLSFATMKPRKRGSDGHGL